MLKGDVPFASGSLRRGSYNAALLREAANALPSGVGHVWLDGIAGLPPYSEDDDSRATSGSSRRRTPAASDAAKARSRRQAALTPGGWFRVSTSR